MEDAKIPQGIKFTQTLRLQSIGLKVEVCNFYTPITPPYLHFARPRANKQN